MHSHHEGDWQSENARCCRRQNFQQEKEDSKERDTTMEAALVAPQLPNVRETTRHTLSRPKSHEEANKNAKACGAPGLHAGAPAEVHMSSGSGASNISNSSLAYFPRPVIHRTSLPSRVQVVTRCLAVSCGDGVQRDIGLSRIEILA